MSTIEFINELIEAERAGAQALTGLIDVSEEPRMRELLRKIGHDEGYWARRLADAVKREGGEPSLETSDFAAKVRAVPKFEDKLALLNRGQRWVVRRIEEQLPNVANPATRGLLQAMAEAHSSNIALVDRAVA